MIYLDNAATSPVDEEVLDAMMPYLREEYGNPSSKYYCKADNARNAVEEARNKVAALFGAAGEEIIFTAGSTESTNMIIKGFLDYSKYYCGGKNHVITSNAEHKATLNVCRYLNGEIYSNNDATVSLFSSAKKVDRGYQATFLEVDKNGIVSADSLEEAITDKTAISSIIYVNNETGSINDIRALADVAHKHGVLFHADVTQAAGKIPVDVNELGVDYISASAHKFYGPKGIGCAYIKSDKYGLPPISALIHGGEQESGIRAGTLAVHNIVGFGKAAEIALRDMEANHKLICDLDDYLNEKIKECAHLSILIPDEHRVKGIISVLVDKTEFNNERFIKRISDEIAISTGSACSLGEPSHVIKALGLKDKTSKILRVSLNKFSTREDIDKFISIIEKSI
ncbi:MAG: cysteine desulfurase [Ruminococcus sp.]|uniref:cysteine desulfurase family protein n=1 Tax=Ruminococcus sp. TaxID=41978 RepID=UPI0025CDE4CE|nr:cysteine desulfurase family protein [Ruminococcus sp.]MCR5541150.1 cysteine desulfurase [Ruminococcus sp.]